MQKILLTAKEALRFLGVTSDRFLSLQDMGKLPAEISNGVVAYDLAGLRKIDISLPKSGVLPESEYTTIAGAIQTLDVCRKTFYSRVKKGEIQLYKDGKRSFVKISDIDPNYDLN